MVPSNYTLSILCKLLGRGRRLEQAFEIVKTFTEEYGFKANIQARGAGLRCMELKLKYTENSLMLIVGPPNPDHLTIPDLGFHLTVSAE